MKKEINLFGRRIAVQGLFIFAFVLIQPSYAPAKNISISGYYKNFFTFEDTPSITGEKTRLTDRNNLHLEFHTPITNNLLFEGAYNFSLRIQDPALSNIDRHANKSAYRIEDLNPVPYHKGSFEIYQNVNRAFFTFKASYADIFAGRQSIAWGSAKTVNPTDIIIPCAITELDKEERAGVDAVRIRIPIGKLGELDSGAVFGGDFKTDESANFLRLKTYLWNTDIYGLLIGFKENLLLGFDMARSMGGAGIWLETAYTFTQAFADYSRFDNENYLRLTAGFDHSLTSNAYIFFEYHLNTAGTTDSKNYTNVLLKTAYTEGSAYLPGRHYAAPGITYQLTPLISAAFSSLLNINDGSCFLSPLAEYNIIEDIYISIGSFTGISSGSTSEFGSYVDIYYASFRLYF